MKTEVIIGLIMLLVFMYLKQKPRKEGSGFISYVSTLVVLAFLLVGGLGLTFSGFGNKEPALMTVVSTEPRDIDTATKEPTIQELSQSKWHIDEKVSPIDDSTTTTISIASDKKIPRSFGYGTPWLLFTCNKQKLEAYVSWDTFISLQSKPVTTRINKDTARTSTWTASTNGEATFSQSPQSFARSLLGKNGELIVQVTPHSTAPVTAVFDINGFEEVIQPLRDKCRF